MFSKCFFLHFKVFLNFLVYGLTTNRPGVPKKKNCIVQAKVTKILTENITFTNMMNRLLIEKKKFVLFTFYFLICIMFNRNH